MGCSPHTRLPGLAEGVNARRFLAVSTTAMSSSTPTHSTSATPAKPSSTDPAVPASEAPAVAAIPAPSPTKTTANHEAGAIIWIAIIIIRVSAVVGINRRRRARRVWVNRWRRCAGHRHWRSCIGDVNLIIAGRSDRRLLLKSLRSLLVSRNRLFLQFTVSENQSACDLLRHTQMLQINNSVRREMEWQGAILNIAYQDVLPNTALVHFDHVRHAQRKCRRLRGHGCWRAGRGRAVRRIEISRNANGNDRCRKRNEADLID